MTGPTRYGNVCFDHTAARTICGTMISRRGDDEARTTALATASGDRAGAERPGGRGMPSNDGPSKNGVRTIMGLTTVTPTPVPASSCLRPSENDSMAAFDAQ